ncbi:MULTISPECIES: ABC transporter permease [unclassified Rhodococcus (in: high G+C Gram-positive bacteria)]|uniref:ABC transporter permease n=1 Tax=unclassified Rhodococcus (in: high G+C Gram-positive bacteria) TaxID=192944 RepID=UPI001E537358|nr:MULTISPECIES: ABC transporter permease [unclassified Rhodococcus (in: high G+C Gram-positive bacteria)]WEX01073.1 ABC transporter permease [Rhodococcus sp. RCBS9]
MSQITADEQSMHRKDDVPPGTPVRPLAKVRRPRNARKSTLLIRVAQLALVVVWLGAWDLTARYQLITPILAKSPRQSWDYFVGAVKNGELWSNGQATMLAVVIAWVLASIVGVVAGITLGLLPTFERILAPFLDAANAMPRIALAPFFIVAFGIGTEAKVALASTLVFFIVLSASRAGVRSADSEWLRLSAVLGAKKHHLFWKIMLPVATPAIIASLRLGLIYALLGVVGSELIAAENGLGQLIAKYSSLFQLEAVYAILILLAVIAVTLNQLMGSIERRLLRWQPPADH